MSQTLDKISKSGTVLESVFNMVADFDHDNYPKKIDPKDWTYQIFYRLEK